MGAAGQSLEDGAQSRTDARVSAPRQRTRDVKLSRCAVRLDLGSSGQLGPEMLPLSASLSFCILFDTLRKINYTVYKVNVKATVKPVSRAKRPQTSHHSHYVTRMRTRVVI